MNPMSLEGHLERFLEGLRVLNAAPGTIRSRQGGVTRFFRYLKELEIEDVREVNRTVIEGYQLALVREGCTPCTRATYLQSLKRFFGYLEDTDVILMNPCLGLRSAKVEQRLPRCVLTRAQTERILSLPDVKTPKGLRDKAILEMLYSTGLRCEEIAALNIYDVDIKAGLLRVTHGKGGKERVVPLGDAASESVRAYMGHVRKPWSQQNREERALWLCAIRPHQPMKSQAIAVMVKDYVRAAGVEHGRVHLWRHTCATHLVANGANVAYVQRILGHRSLDTTQIYTKVALPEVQRTHARHHPRSKKRG